MSASIGRRRFLAALPALAMSPRILAQSSPPPAFRANGLSQITLTVSDVARSLEFYQGLFGMPIQARQGSTVLLRIGNGPRFLALRQAAGGERPSISALGIGVQDFSLDRAMKTLAAHGIAAAPSDAEKPGPKQALVRTRRQNEGGSADGSTRDLFVADPSGVVFQLHDVSYCGGSGALGNMCPAPQPSPKPGLIAVKDTSHFTIAASDTGTVPMYLELFGFRPVPATLAGYTAGGVLSYILNRRITYASDRPHAEATWRFAVVAAIGLFLTWGFMALFISLLGPAFYVPAQLVTTGIVLVWHFVAHKLWTFAHPAPSAAKGEG